ncbi:MAG: hypothetical protein AAGG01_13660 [Planctomycetota bacterium]
MRFDILRRAGLAACAATPLIACQTTYRAYEGVALPEQQVAIVRVRGDNGVVGVIAQPVGGPHIVEIVAINGEKAEGNNRNDFLPGTYTLRVRAEGSGIERDGYFKTTQDITVDLKAGMTYWIEPRYSEHVPPWSLNVTLEPGGDPVATTEPRRSDLDLLPLPPSPERWSEVEWTRTPAGDSAIYVPEGQTVDRWRRRVWLMSERWQEATTASRLRVEFIEAILKAGGEAEGDVLASDAWLVRWSKPTAGRSAPDDVHRGVTYFRGTEQLLYRATFETHHRPTAEAECTEWEQRFVGIRD